MMLTLFIVKLIISIQKSILHSVKSGRMIITPDILTVLAGSIDRIYPAVQPAARFNKGGCLLSSSIESYYFEQVKSADTEKCLHTTIVLRAQHQKTLFSRAVCLIFLAILVLRTGNTRPCSRRNNKPHCAIKRARIKVVMAPIVKPTKTSLG